MFSKMKIQPLMGHIIQKAAPVLDGGVVMYRLVVKTITDFRESGMHCY